MKKESIQKGWKWVEVKHLNDWKLPDGSVTRLHYLLEGDISKKIYDLGCGIGRHTIFFASKGYQVYASDIAKEAVEKTQEWLNERNLSADVQQGRMTEIIQLNNTFDLVIGFNVIYHAYKEDVIKTISEVYRILKPGGHFYGTLITKEKDIPFRNGRVIDEQTLIIEEGVERGIPHFFSSKKDLLEFFTNFNILDVVYTEKYKPPYSLKNLRRQEGSGHFRFYVQKPIVG